MAKFHYVLSDISGVKEENTFYAGNIDAAKRALQKTNKIILSLSEEVSRKSYFWQRPHLGFQDRMMFVKHMTTMLRAGITITESLEMLISQTRRAGNRLMFQNILDMIQAGQSLSKCLREYPKVFSDIFVNMIATGEESGTLEKTFSYLDTQLEKEYDLRQKIIGAFMYPAVIMVITVLFSFGIVVFIMPKIIKMFASLKVELPLVTRILVGFSMFVTGKPLLSLFLFVAGLSFFVFLFRARIFQPFWSAVAIRLPIFGKLIIYVNLVRFSRTMHSLLQSGVPITKALDITEKMIGNRYYKAFIRSAKEKVEQGGQLGESFHGADRFFPLPVTRMLFIGEKSGSLPTTTEHIAEMYEQKVDSITRNLSVLLEPLLLVFMGTLVGGVAISIILPIYQLPSLLQK
ncbi:type II secretion system F family protein [Candidatus Peregrinibacteria bacterium]|nr:type II secretion system F family protein [Candidatus Peregrinibacteria bacterium]